MTDDAVLHTSDHCRNCQSLVTHGEWKLVPDELLGAAAAYDEKLRSGSEGTDSHAPFESANPRIAKTLRLLRDVLGEQADAAVGQPPLRPDADASGTIVLFTTGISSSPSKTISPPQPTQPVCPIRFQVISELGRGSYGIVFHAHDTWLKRDVAIKFLKPEFLGESSLRNRFLLESRAAARLNHPSIVRVLEANEDDTAAWQISELVTGSALSAHIERGPIPARVSARIARDLADAVHHAHTSSVLHRDIKPDNVLVDKRPGESLGNASVRLTDFGLARIVDEAMQISRSGTLIGTPRYMAPEQLTGRVSDHGPQTDVYALGVVLYEMLTGQCPFENVTSIPERIAMLQTPVRSVRTSQPDVSRDLTTICQKCLEVKVAHRYPSAADLRNDLQQFLEGRPTTARPLSVQERLWRWSIRNKAVAALISGGILAAMLIFGLILRNNRIFHSQNLQLQTSNDELFAEQKRVRQFVVDTQLLRVKAEAEQIRFQKQAWNAGIRQAYSAWEKYEVAEALRLLESLKTTDPDAESRIEWQLLYQELKEFRQPLLKLDVPIHEVRLIPNSTLAVVAAGDGSLYFVDLETGILSQKIQTGVPSLHALAVSPDGNLVATGGHADPVTDLAYPIIFEVASGREISRLPGQLTTIESLEFSADQKWLACGARYDNLQIINLETQQIVSAPTSRRNLWIARLDKSKRLLAQSTDLSLWKSGPETPSDGEVIEVPSRLTSAVAVPNTDYLLCGLGIGVNLHLVDESLRNVICGFVGGAQTISSISVSNDLSLLAAGLENGDLVCWQFPDLLDDMESKQAISVLGEKSDRLTRYSGASTGFYDIAEFREKVRWHLFDSPVTSVIVTDHRILAASQNGELVSLPRWLPNHGELTLSDTLDSKLDYVESVAWVDDGQTLMTGSASGTIRRIPFDEHLLRPGAAQSPDWHHQALAVISEMVTPANDGKIDPSYPVMALAVSKDSQFMATYRIGKGLSVTTPDDPATVVHWRPVDDTHWRGIVHAMAFSPDAHYIAWTGSDNTLHIRSTHPGDDAIIEVPLEGSGNCLVWSADQSKVFVGGRFEKTIAVCAQTGVQTVLEQSTTRMQAIVFDPQRSTLISGHDDGTLRFRNLLSGESNTLHFHDIDVQAIALSHGGTVGVSADVDANLAVWFAETGERIGILRSMSKRPVNVGWMRPSLMFTENDARFQVVYDTHNHELTVKSWLLKQPVDSDCDTSKNE